MSVYPTPAALIERIGRIRSVYEARNWRKKHQAEIDDLRVDDIAAVMTAYFARISGLNASSAAPNQPEETAK